MVNYALRPVETFNQHATCECGGEFKSDGSAFPTNPPKYQHICDRCGKFETLRHKHPRTIHVEQHHGWKGYHVEIVTSSEEREANDRIRSERGGVIKCDFSRSRIYTADGECTIIIIAGADMDHVLETVRGLMINTIRVSSEARAKLGDNEYNQLMAALNVRRVTI